MLVLSSPEDQPFTNTHSVYLACRIQTGRPVRDGLLLREGVARS